MTINLDYKYIHNTCVQIKKMFDKYDFNFDTIVGVSRGGLLPATILSHIMETPMVPICYSSRQGNGDDKNHKNTIPEIPGNIILIVDDIVDSGNTMYELKHLIEQQGKSVYTCCIIYKQRKVPMIIPDFKGMMIEESDGWVIFPYENKNEL